jgi:uncharacterized protein (TIGR00369 family)|tara:strand:- start:2372 stop:2818 length:447 start_codon:yes stop_codon:yes gene_type:complete
MIDPNHFEPIDDRFISAVMTSVTTAPFTSLVGLQLEEIRRDYSRMRLPYREEINQSAGLIHGGATATLIDTTVVGAVYSGLDPNNQPKGIVTVDMHIHYTNAGIAEDLIAHGAVRRRGRTIVFLEVDVVGANSGKLIAHGELSYMIMY